MFGQWAAFAALASFSLWFAREVAEAAGIQAMAVCRRLQPLGERLLGERGALRPDRGGEPALGGFETGAALGLALRGTGVSGTEL